jgi:hypothetical protein
MGLLLFNEHGMYSVLTEGISCLMCFEILSDPRSPQLPCYRYVNFHRAPTVVETIRGVGSPSIRRMCYGLRV